MHFHFWMDWDREITPTAGQDLVTSLMMSTGKKWISPILMPLCIYLLRFVYTCLVSPQLVFNLDVNSDEGWLPGVKAQPGFHTVFVPSHVSHSASLRRLRISLTCLLPSSRRLSSSSRESKKWQNKTSLGVTLKHSHAQWMACFTSYAPAEFGSTYQALIYLKTSKSKQVKDQFRVRGSQQGIVHSPESTLWWGFVELCFLCRSQPPPPYHTRYFSTNFFSPGASQTKPRELIWRISTAIGAGNNWTVIVARRCGFENYLLCICVSWERQFSKHDPTVIAVLTGVCERATETAICCTCSPRLQVGKCLCVGAMFFMRNAPIFATMTLGRFPIYDYILWMSFRKLMT